MRAKTTIIALLMAVAGQGQSIGSIIWDSISAFGDAQLTNKVNLNIEIN